MMGWLNRDRGQLFYSFCLDEAVPDDHRVREIAAALELSWVHGVAGDARNVPARKSARGTS
jgi:hypothetical protein